MNPKTLKALQESIAHHERLRDGVKGEELSRIQCSLCKLYNNILTPIAKNCIGCPVYEKTGMKYCKGTPFYKQEAMSRFDGIEVTLKRHGKAWTDACQAEIDFLKSLLP